MSARSVESTSTASTLSPDQLIAGVSSNENGVYPPRYSPSRFAVEADGGGGHDAREVHEHALALESSRQTEVAPVDRDELIASVVEAVPGQNAVGVREGHPLEAAIVEIRSGGAPTVWPPYSHFRFKGKTCRFEVGAGAAASAARPAPRPSGSRDD